MCTESYTDFMRIYKDSKLILSGFKTIYKDLLWIYIDLHMGLKKSP